MTIQEKVSFFFFFSFVFWSNPIFLDLVTVVMADRVQEKKNMTDGTMS